ncbi:uncharacterized protein LOC125226443 [Leguminivora glycinivorella]|uniref:uncharacterized protein LOC125226443 n=1 Tax=Leguminivora glycinivorella TaxID=1035111 RepID=UPI00200C7D9F|nr:uncharacterized protein LOC125226443 [Leguminivora glycinivorella]
MIHCYAPLQGVSAGAWARVASAPPPLTLRAQQRSLDTELLCNEYLHLLAHGAGYAPLQGVSAGAWARVASAPPPLTLRAQQRSLDTELLCNEYLHLLAHGAGYAPLQGVSAGAWARVASAPPPLTLRAQQRSLDTELLCNEYLHLLAHGAGYAPLQGVSAGAWARVTSAPPPLTLRAQQRSLDTELLCNEVCGRLCKLNGKKFIYCFDWGCHVIDVCQSSGCLSGLCAMWLWASDDTGACEPCRAISAGCPAHRLQYAAECLFVWDLVSGVYRTEKVTMTEDASQEGSRVSGADRARELAKKLGPINMPSGCETRLLTTLTGRSLKRLTDVDNCIEITKNHPDSSESESEPEEEDSD